MKKYVLITPARNEEKYIEGAIQSVLQQTIKPERWVIVSDGSVDRTDEIVSKYAAENDFIIFRRTTSEPLRNFVSKVAAFNYGYEALEGVEYDFIGNLDADMTFEKDYYEQILNKFEGNPKLGLAGGVRTEAYKGKYYLIKSHRKSVAGAFQLFRKQCYEKIGGYKPLKYGGIDAVAETMSKMYGWEVESFVDIKLCHHKSTGLSHQNVYKARFRLGIQYYTIGYHPLFSVFRAFFRIKDKPKVISSFTILLGYFWGLIRRYERPVSAEFIKYLREDQIRRLKEIISKSRIILNRNKINLANRKKYSSSNL